MVKISISNLHSVGTHFHENDKNFIQEICTYHYIKGGIARPPIDCPSIPKPPLPLSEEM